METTYKNIEVGADRFLALEWVNFAFELYHKQNDALVSYQILREYLDGQIEGKESSRKTSNQIKRLWLTQDHFEYTRRKVLELPYPINPELVATLHLGIAVNVFPIYNETAKAISLLSGLGDVIPKQSVVNRVMETFANPSAIPRSISRVLQTLENWRLIKQDNQNISLANVSLEEPGLASWMLLAAVCANGFKEVLLPDLVKLPQLVGIKIVDIRKVIKSGGILKIYRNIYGKEVVSSTDEQF